MTSAARIIVETHEIFNTVAAHTRALGAPIYLRYVPTCTHRYTYLRYFTHLPTVVEVI